MRNHLSHATVLWAWEYRDDDHPRPDEVTRLETLLNTIDHHRFGDHESKPNEGRDLLATSQAVKAWLVDHDLLAHQHDVAAREPDDLRAFRDQLRSYLERRHSGQPPSGDWPPTTLRLGAHIDTDTSSLTLTPTGDGVRAALERLLADAVLADAKETLQRLKICAADDCRFAYYDHSRSRTSRWCSMRTCGNRAKTRRYRSSDRSEQMS